MLRRLTVRHALLVEVAGHPSVEEVASLAVALAVASDSISTNKLTKQRVVLQDCGATRY